MKLKPCPFCGSEDVIICPDFPVITCLGCEANGPEDDPTGEKWNAAVSPDPLTILFNSDKEVGSLKATDGNHGIHIANNHDAVIGKRGETKYGGAVPNDHTVAMLQFTSPKSIDEVIKWLAKSKEFFKTKEAKQ